MAKLTRYLQKIFANNSNQVGVFGTGVDKETSKNVETLQSADYEEGWSSAVITDKNYPIWQERDGVDYGLSYQIKYLEQAGIPEWLATETYYTNSYCRMGADLYYSLQDNNLNQNPTTATTYWKKIDKDPANKTLSNVTSIASGSAVQTALNGKLSTSGGTIDWINVSGSLQKQGVNNPSISIKHLNYAYTDTPAESTGMGLFQVVDKNGDWFAIFGTEFYTDGRNLAKMQVRAKNGDQQRIQIWADSSNKFHCSFPMCTTKPTTTSSAGADLISAVKQNYVNGTSGYIVYTDGLIVQWGSSNGGTNVSISFLKSFSNANYSLVLTPVDYSTGDNLTASAGSLTASGFKLTSSRVSVFEAHVTRWLAIGY